MKDPYNPTHKDILNWAYDINALNPIDEDWELMVAEYRNIDVLLSLANDSNCPKQIWSLRCLYTTTGCIVSSLSLHRHIPVLNIAIEKAMTSDNTKVCKWAKDSKYLIEHPETFVYDDWRFGDLANKTEQ